MKKIVGVVLAFGLVGCSLESKDISTGGVDATGSTMCPAGMVAVLGDYVTSQVALLDLQGNALSESFLSSGSTMASQLAAPFSGDLGLPSTPSASGEIVILDRFGTNVLTWVDPKTATVRAQLPIGTGFESNPYDYLELSKTKAYVARFGENTTPGKVPFDQGGDILIVDPSVPRIVSSISLPRESSFPPAPVSLTLRGKTAIVVLQRYDSATFKLGADSELLGLNTESDVISWHITLSGKKACGRAELSPSGKLLAISCTGEINSDGALVNPTESGVLVFDAVTEPPTLKKTIPVHQELGFSSQGNASFASEDTLLGTTQTLWMGAGNNQLFALNLETEKATVLATARPDKDGKGKGVVYAVKCLPGCGDRCLLADKDLGQIRRFDIKASFAEGAPVTIGSGSGLPPVGLGAF